MRRLLVGIVERISSWVPYSRHQSQVHYLQLWGHVNTETEVTTEALLQIHADLRKLEARIAQLERRNL